MNAGMELSLFRALIAAHILAGSIGALAFWVPVIGRKGGARHRRFGRVFVVTVSLTGALAVAMSLCTLADPLGVHPWLRDRFDAPFIRGIFGWMMLHNGLLTVDLACYGWLCVRNGRDTKANRTIGNVSLQAIVLRAALTCAWQGWSIGQPLMMGIAVVGLATASTNLTFLLRAQPSPSGWLKEHIKASVGAGISVYTAFLAFGSVRVFPALALHPVTWAVPLVVGLVIIVHHRLRVQRLARRSLLIPNAGTALQLD